MLSLGLAGSHLGSRITASNMNLMKSALDGSINFDETNSFSFIETKYLVSVLKNRSVQAN